MFAHTLAGWAEELIIKAASSRERFRRARREVIAVNFSSPPRSAAGGGSSWIAPPPCAAQIAKPEPVFSGSQGMLLVVAGWSEADSEAPLTSGPPLLNCDLHPP